MSGNTVTNGSDIQYYESTFTVAESLIDGGCTGSTRPKAKDLSTEVAKLEDQLFEPSWRPTP